MLLKSCLFALCALSSLLLAQVPVMLESSGILTADPRHGGTLDTPQPDTLRYDNGSTQSLQPQTNYWIYTRFTTPQAFDLVSVYFFTINTAGNQSACSLYVMTVTGTQPGTVLANWRLNGNVPHFAWNDTNLPDTVHFEANTDFLIVMGPVPGGPQSAGWHPILDNGASNTRTGVAFTGGRMGTYQYTQSGYWLLRAGGIVAPFRDISADEVYNSTSANEPSFNVEVGETISLHSLVSNRGNQAIPSYTVSWNVEGPDGSVVYDDEVTGTTLPQFGTATLNSPESFTCDDAGEYYVTCEVTYANDANDENNLTFLRFFAGGNHRWYRYDDNGDVESSSGFTEGSGWGLSFTPTFYPASIESIRVGVGGAGAGDFRIYMNGDDGMPAGNPVWSSTPTVVAGWNRFAVNPPVIVFNGSFTIAYLYGDPVTMGSDQGLPNCAGISNMGVIAWQAASDGAEWFEDQSGNLCFQAWVDTTSALPPFPVIDTTPDTLMFGDVDTTGNASNTIQLWVANRGGQNALHVTAMQFTPASIRPAFSVTPSTLTVAAGDSEMVSVTFNPIQVRAYNGLFELTNDSDNDPSFQLLVRANGVAGVWVDEQHSGVPTTFQLSQNFPNPFNPSTEIEFALPTASNVRLSVYNLLGEQVQTLVNSSMSAGYHRASFNAADLPSGIYYYRIEAGDFTAIRKMLLMK